VRVSITWVEQFYEECHAGISTVSVHKDQVEGKGIAYHWVENVQKHIFTRVFPPV
jgi:hypothetical protein